MITILRLSPDREWSADHCDVGLDEGFARAAATTEPGGLTYVFDRESDRVCRIDRSHRGDCHSDEANGYHLIWLGDRLSGGDPMYRFTARSVARDRVLALVDARWPVAGEAAIKEAAE